MADVDEGDLQARIERLLQQILRADPRHKEIVAEIQSLIQRLAPAPRSASRRRTGEATRYTVDGKGENASLSEYRASSQPLRVSKSSFDHVVHVLVAADRPLGFDEIMQKLARASVDAPADWQVRVALRFLQRAEPTLIRRTRSRYHAAVQEGLEAAASKWWKSASA